MRLSGSAFRLVAVVLVVALALTVAMPAKADAMDPFTIIAIASAGVVVLILVVYLIVANVHDSRRAAGDRPVYLACVETAEAPRACWQTSQTPAEIAAELTVAPVLVPAPVQGP
jgi:hypothetical protein